MRRVHLSLAGLGRLIEQRRAAFNYPGMLATVLTLIAARSSSTSSAPLHADPSVEPMPSHRITNT